MSSAAHSRKTMLMGALAAIGLGGPAIGMAQEPSAVPNAVQTGTSTPDRILRSEDLGFTDAQVLSLLERGPVRRTAPGISFGSPVAFGLDWGEAGIGLGGTYRPDDPNKKLDGSLALILGLGDANESVGLEVSAEINSLAAQNGQDSFGSEGAFGAKLHTALPYRSAVALGVENVGRYGRDTKKTESSVYVVGTKYFDLRPRSSFTYPVAINVGLGDGRFLPEARGNNDQINVFGSLEFLLNRRTSLAVDWTGRDLNVGLSFVPFESLPFVASIGGVNLTQQRDHQAAVAVSLGYLIRF